MCSVYYLRTASSPRQAARRSGADNKFFFDFFRDARELCLIRVEHTRTIGHKLRAMKERNNVKVRVRHAKALHGKSDTRRTACFPHGFGKKLRGLKKIDVEGVFDLEHRINVDFRNNQCVPGMHGTRIQKSEENIVLPHLHRGPCTRDYFTE